MTGPRLRTLLRRFAPRVTVAWMNRAARFTPPGDWVLAGRLGGYYDLAYYRHCDHLIGNTRSIVDWITHQGWPAARAHHLPNFSPDMASAIPASLGLPNGVRIVLALGRLHPNKAFDVLVRALPALPGVHAVIAGDGPERAACSHLPDAKGSSTGCICWAGAVTPLRCWQRQICWYARRVTNRWAMSSWKPGPLAVPSWPPRPMARVS